jgi:hypothetical protein
MNSSTTARRGDGSFAEPSSSRSFYDRNGSFAVDTRGTVRPTILIGDVNRRNVVTPEGAQ